MKISEITVRNKFTPLFGLIYIPKYTKTDKAMRIIFIVLMLSSFTSAYSDTRVMQNYIFDAVGNVVGIEVTADSNPPSVSQVAPLSVRAGKTTHIQVTGTDLSNAMPSSGMNEFQFSNMLSTSTELEFDVFIEDSIIPGSYDLEISTSLGASNHKLEVIPPVPRVALQSSGVALLSGETKDVVIQFSNADILDHQINITLSSAGVASVNLSQITLPASATNLSFPLQITGIGEGEVSLDITSSTIMASSWPVSVIDGSSDHDGDGLSYSFELANGYDPLNPDTDKNGIFDGNEDPDGDTLTNRQEEQQGSNILLVDTDGDGWDDAIEFEAGSNPAQKLSLPIGPVISTAQPTKVFIYGSREVTIPSTVVAHPRSISIDRE